ncbi:MAG: hypothetical protein IJ173_02215 [Kiritimatiellae bacterium]|nr:hypothetical protein [Kiritimatiellia bacterium]
MKQKLAAAVASVAALASLTARCVERSYNWKEAAQDNSWANAANWHYWANNAWQENDGYPNALTHGAEFWKDATVGISGEETIGELKIGANVVLDGGTLIVGDDANTTDYHEVYIASKDKENDWMDSGTLEVKNGTLKVVQSNCCLDVGRGSYSTATLTVSGGTVEAHTLRLGYGEGATGTVNLNSGTLSVCDIADGNGMGEIVFNGGTLQINNDVYLDKSKITLTMAEGGVTFDIPDLGTNEKGEDRTAQIVNAITYADGVTSATLTKSGAGDLALKGTTAATKIVAKGGTLKFWDSASVNDKYALELAGGTAADTTFSSIEITDGAYALGSLPATSADSVTLSGGTLTASADSASPTLSKTVVLNGGTLEITIDSAVGIEDSQEFSISGISLGADGSVNDIVLTQGETTISCAAISLSGTTLKLRKLTDDETKGRWLGATESYKEESNWGAGWRPWTKIFGAYKGASTSVTMDVAETDQNGDWKFYGSDFFTFIAQDDAYGKDTTGNQYPGGLVISGLEGCGAKIVGGTYVFGNSIYIANEESSCGQLEIASGSVTAKNDDVKVGEKGTGELIVSGGSLVVEEKWLGVGVSGGTGTLRLMGGSVSVPGIYSYGTGTVYLDGGTLVATSADGNGLLQASLSNVFVGEGGAIIDTGANSPSIKVELKPESSLGAADGGLVKRGTGTLTFTVAPTFTGRVSVEQGVVVLPAGSAIEPDGATTFKVTESSRDYFYPLASAVAGDAGVEYPSEAAATEAAKNGVAIPSAVAAVLDTNEKVAAYRALFSAEAKQVDGSKWFVYVDFTENAKSELGASLTQEFADVDFSKLSSEGNASVTIAHPVAGLYYRLCSGTDVNNLAPGTAKLSDGSPLALTLDAKGACTFYRLNVSTTDNN